ncbi:MAG TPA: alpha/beta hydrolase [Candidatus Acidoferrales bacterium]|nr:alpha/beta hydrolase [Candidatus Acidoferrales bacterium]
MSGRLRDRFVVANRLRLHLLEWGSGDHTVLLLHGFLEHAHAWDFVAPLLANAGFHVFALDWRGHGDSQWIGAGGYYHFIDYVADLADLVPQLGESVALVAHSMGGGAAILYAGARPQRVRSLVSVEGLGMPDFDATSILDRVTGWLDDLQRVARREPQVVDLEAAVTRYRQRFPRFSAAAARHIVEHNTRVVDGRRFWKFDPLHQTRAPLPTPVAYARAFWARVACPALYIDGSESFLRLPKADLEERLAALRAERVTLADTAHHPHIEQPEVLAERLREFLSR